MIKFRNLDRDAMELESDSLKIEKVVAAGKDATIKVKARSRGVMSFSMSTTRRPRGARSSSNSGQRQIAGRSTCAEHPLEDRVDVLEVIAEVELLDRKSVV